MLRAYVFIDGGYLRSGLERLGVPWQEVDLRSVALVAMAWVGAKWQGEVLGVSRVFVYDAVPAQHLAGPVEEWLERNDSQLDVHIRRGLLAAGGRRGREQKSVDVQLAVDMLSFATNNVFDAAVLVSGDADFIPVVEAVRDKGPLVAICAFRDSISPELIKAADRIGYLPSNVDSWKGWPLPPAAS